MTVTKPALSCNNCPLTLQNCPVLTFHKPYISYNFLQGALLNIYKTIIQTIQNHRQCLLTCPIPTLSVKGTSQNSSLGCWSVYSNFPVNLQYRFYIQSFTYCIHSIFKVARVSSQNTDKRDPVTQTQKKKKTPQMFFLFN